MSTLPANLAEAKAKAETLTRERLELERTMLVIGAIAGRDGLSACVAGVQLRVQRLLPGPNS